MKEALAIWVNLANEANHTITGAILKQFVLAHNMQIKSTFIIYYYDKVGYLVNIKSDTGRVRLIEFAYVQLLNGTTSSRNQFISKLFERLSYTRTYYPHIN